MVSGPVEAVPLVTFVPDQAPEAVQVVASVLLHVSVELFPLMIGVGVAIKVTVGAGGAVTVTVADAEALPAAPVQATVYVLVVVRAVVVAEPLVACVPDHAPEATQLVAFVLLHVRVEMPPLVTEVGLAVRVTVGGVPFTATVADAEPLPPVPVHVSV